MRRDLADFDFANPQRKQPQSECASPNAGNLPLAAQLLVITSGEQGVAPSFLTISAGQRDQIKSTASEDYLHSREHVVPSYPAVLLAYQQYRRMAEAVASSPRHPVSERCKQFCYQARSCYERRIKRTIHPTRKSHTFL